MADPPVLLKCYSFPDERHRFPYFTMFVYQNDPREDLFLSAVGSKPEAKLQQG